MELDFKGGQAHGLMMAVCSLIATTYAKEAIMQNLSEWEPGVRSSASGHAGEAQFLAGLDYVLNAVRDAAAAKAEVDPVMQPFKLYAVPKAEE